MATSSSFSRMSELETVLSADQPSASTPSSDGLFTPFTRLPPELRLRVWFFANSHPRVILIEPEPGFVIRSDGSLDNRQCAAESTTPALLHVCHESRDFALKNYKLRFSGQISRQVYFDECKDILAFRSNLACRSFSTIDDWYRRRIIPNVRFLVFAFPYSPLNEDLSDAVWSTLSYTNLEILYVKSPLRANKNLYNLQEVLKAKWREYSESRLREPAAKENQKVRVSPPKVVYISSAKIKEKFGFEVAFHYLERRPD